METTFYGYWYHLKESGPSDEDGCVFFDKYERQVVGLWKPECDGPYPTDYFWMYLVVLIVSVGVGSASLYRWCKSPQTNSTKNQDPEMSTVVSK